MLNSAGEAAGSVFDIKRFAVNDGPVVVHRFLWLIVHRQLELGQNSLLDKNAKMSQR